MRRSRACVALAVAALFGSIFCGCGPRVYNDGIYKGISQADKDGYAIADVTVDRDKIVEVKLIEVTELGVEKDYATYPYGKAREANAEMARRFAGKSDVKGVDAYAGATTSSRKYIEAVRFALEKARKTPTAKTTYFEGTFFGRSEAGEQGHGVAWVTIKSDKITGVKLDEVTPEGAFKDWATYVYPEALIAKDTLQRTFVEKNGPVVDAHTGATDSSRGWMEAVADALSNARVR